MAEEKEVLKKDVLKEEQEENVNGGKAGGPAVCPNCGSTNCRYSRDKYPMVHCMCCGCDFWD